MIDSKDNKRIKEIKKLIKSSKERQDKGLFIVEGIRILSEVPSDILVKCFYKTSFLKKNKDFVNCLKDRCKNTNFEEVSDDIFNNISDTKTPQGIIGICKMFEYCLEDIVSNERGPFVLLEDIQDPGNLGTIVRTSEATDVSCVILSKGCVDFYSPKVIRSTMGTTFRVPIITKADLESTIKMLQKNDVCIFAADLEGSTDLYETSFDNKTAILIGNEGNGLKKETSDMANKKVRIPMGGKVESLNAGVATSVILYEIKRQKNY